LLVCCEQPATNNQDYGLSFTFACTITSNSIAVPIAIHNYFLSFKPSLLSVPR
jgi:hypothetical protein